MSPLSPAIHFHVEEEILLVFHPNQILHSQLPSNESRLSEFKGSDPCGLSSYNKNYNERNVAHTEMYIVRSDNFIYLEYDDTHSIILHILLNLMC
jgi:hypothetical protein